MMMMSTTLPRCRLHHHDETMTKITSPPRLKLPSRTDKAQILRFQQRIYALLAIAVIYF
jgi:hypothetical protein